MDSYLFAVTNTNLYIDPLSACPLKGCVSAGPILAVIGWEAGYTLRLFVYQRGNIQTHTQPFTFTFTWHVFGWWEKVRESTQTRGEHADSTQTGTRPTHGFKHRSFSLWGTNINMCSCFLVRCIKSTPAYFAGRLNRAMKVPLLLIITFYFNYYCWCCGETGEEINTFSYCGVLTGCRH